jgi:glucosyl-dolichyl phosphate glucuronosyltransferase
VDNAADPQVRDLVSRVASNHRAPVSYIPEPELGLHHARHRGAAAAASELLVFTDDDATFSPGWLTAYARAFAKHLGMAAASGPVRAMWTVTPPRWLTDYVDTMLAEIEMFPALSLLDRRSGFRITPREVLFGVNMAVRRTELIAHGGFSPEIFGKTWLGSGESGLNYRLASSRRGIGYVPNAVVYHHVEAERMSVSYLTRRMRNEGASHVYSRVHGSPMPRLRLATLIARGLIFHGPLVAAGTLASGATGSRALRLQLAAAHRAGRVAYAWRLLTDSALRNMLLSQVRPAWPAPY